jgi:hypothetical protein
MTKISIHNSSKLNISAKSGDTFLLSIDISDESGSLVSFSNLNSTHFLPAHGSIKEELLFFVVFSNEYEPLLLASRDVLKINEAPNYFVGTSNMHAGEVIHSIAVADYLSQYAGNNTFEEEVTNFLTVTETNPNIISGPTTSLENNYLSKFYRPHQSASPLPSSSISIANQGSRYIAWGELSVEGLNSASLVLINFKANEFNLPKGKYKYALINLKTPAYHDESGTFPRQVYVNSSTILEGKLTVQE